MRLPFALASRFVAGEDFDHALPQVQEINRKGIKVTLDLLGENVKDRESSTANTAAYIDLLDQIDNNTMEASISVKLTMLGLDVSYDFCKGNLFKLLDTARQHNNFVRVDMEGSDYTEDTMKLFKEAFKQYGNHVGIVIQAYLHRSRQDIDELAKMGADVRLCKGAYDEPERLALQKMPDIRDAFKEYTATLLQHTNKPRIATHDDKLISWIKNHAEKNGIGKARFEIQMLYGLREETMVDLTAEGYDTRIYVPFGTEWLPYFTRRLKERKENIWFVLKNFLKR